MDVIRVWKDPEYRDGMSKSVLAQAPANPAGLSRLVASEPELMVAAGTGAPKFTYGCCQPYTFMGTTVYCAATVWLC